MWGTLRRIRRGRGTARFRRYTFAADEHLFGFIYDGPWLDGQKHGTGVLIRLLDKKRFLCTFMRDTLRQQGRALNPETDF